MNRKTLSKSTPALSLRPNSLWLAVAATLSLPGAVLAAEVALPRIDVVGDDTEARRAPGSMS